MSIHRISASQMAWLNNYDGTARLALKVAGVTDTLTIKDGDHLYVTVQITQGRLSLKELSIFVQLNDSKGSKR